MVLIKQEDWGAQGKLCRAGVGLPAGLLSKVQASEVSQRAPVLLRGSEGCGGGGGGGGVGQGRAGQGVA